jgi:hypothetical protein
MRLWINAEMHFLFILMGTELDIIELWQDKQETN